jgi:peroxiredoxin
MPTTTSGGLPIGAAAPAFDLPDPQGRRHALKDFAEAQALLVVFMCNHCPYVKHLKQALVDFAAKYQPRGLAMVAINANDWSRYAEDSPQKMQVDIDTYGYPFPYLVDESQSVAKAYGAVCTPGRPVTGADLSLAVEAAFAGEPFAREQNPAMGCSIKWR